MTTTTAERIICNTDIINAKVPGYQGLQMIWVNEQGSMEKNFTHDPAVSKTNQGELAGYGSSR